LLIFNLPPCCELDLRNTRNADAAVDALIASELPISFAD